MSVTEDTGEPAPIVNDANPAASENKGIAGTPAPDKPAAGNGGGGSGGGGGDDAPSKLTSIYKSTTSFMGLVGKEWLSSLLSQPADPPFSYDAKFPDAPVRIMRLVVMSVFLTGLVVLSERFLSKNTPTLVLTMAIQVVIATFLIAIVYTVFAMVCRVRVYQADGKRRQLTLGQIFFSILYVFVPWIPIFAFLWSFALGGGQLRLLLMIILFYLSFAYVIFNFIKALRQVTRCPAYRVWLSVLLPLAIVVSYLVYRI